VLLPIHNGMTTNVMKCRDWKNRGSAMRQPMACLTYAAFYGMAADQ